MLRTKYLIFVLVLFVSLQTGCQNYRDIEKINIVLGMAIDQDEERNVYIVTVEVVDFKEQSKDVGFSTVLVKSEGETIFDAIRNAIKKTGKRLYFSHMSVVIICKNSADSGLADVLDWLHRDNEIRHNVDFLISEGKASEIYEACKASHNDIVALKLSDTLDSDRSLSKIIKTDLLTLIKAIESKYQTATVPIVKLVTEGNKSMPYINGTAVLKGDKYVGNLNEDETKTLLFILDEVKGGLIVTKFGEKDQEKKMALEIIKSSTQMKSDYKNDDIVIKISVSTEVKIGEYLGIEDFSKEENIEKISKNAEKEMKTKIQNLVKKVQKEFRSDIFGFAKEVYVHNPEKWEEVKDYWEQEFLLVKLEVQSDIRIKDSALTKDPIKVGLQNGLL